MCAAVPNPVPRLITLRQDHSAGLFLPDSDVTIDLFDDVASSAGVCVIESTNSFYWIDDVSGALTGENYTSRVSTEYTLQSCGRDGPHGMARSG